MADDGSPPLGETSGENNRKSGENQDEVFVNGESDVAKGENYLKPDYSGAMPAQPLPRRSSLMKDASRRNQRKKTVSFTSMPNEKTVINGKFLVDNYNAKSMTSLIDMLKVNCFSCFPIFICIFHTNIVSKSRKIKVLHREN